LVLGLLAVVAVVGAGMTGYRWWLDSQLYVSTDNAQITGRLIQVGGTSAGRVAEVRYDVGAPIRKDTVVAAIYAPVPVGTTANGQPKLEFRQTSDALVEVTAPVDGVVIARNANAGDTVPAGQPLLTLVDPKQLWINANVEETVVKRLQVGQPVEIHVDALDATVSGHVKAITPASAATFSLLPSQNTAGNFTKQTQLVPVKIELDQPEPRLSIGTSVEVKIRVAP
jgi:multidrug resistance efflux pump